MASYFTSDGLRFLAQLKTHNEKSWFEANKQRYEEGLRDPGLRLVADLAPVLKKLSKHVRADPSPNGGSLSRIHRDVRFSKDKSPYKTALSLRFLHDEGGEEAMPAFYLHLEPGASAIGGGIWHPATPALEEIREAIVESPAAWARAKRSTESGSSMGGESLKNVPRGYEPDHRYAEDLKRKDFGLHQPLSDDALVSSSLTAEIERGFRAAAPLLKFVCGALGLPY